MKHILIIAILALSGTIASVAQNILPQLKRETPDMEQIRREITDRSGQYYYPRLMKEYLRNDTLMKIDKFRRLYLGYMLQEDYDPYRPSPVRKDLSALYNTRKQLTREQCDTVAKYARLSLDNNPFDLRSMALLIQALRDKGDINAAKVWQYKLNYILMAIVSTGTGSEDDEAWWVVEPQHEYVLLNMMGFTVVDHAFIEPYFERIKVKDSHGRDAGEFYFNIQTVLDEHYRKYPEEE